MTFTPTPWKNDDGLVYGRDSTDEVFASFDIYDAAHWPGSEQEGMANAALIAAAPDLLGALKRAETHFRMLPDDMDEPGSVMAEMREAIAKATNQ